MKGSQPGHDDDQHDVYGQGSAAEHVEIATLIHSNLMGQYCVWHLTSQAKKVQNSLVFPFVHPGLTLTASWCHGDGTVGNVLGMNRDLPQDTSRIKGILYIIMFLL